MRLQGLETVESDHTTAAVKDAPARNGHPTRPRARRCAALGLAAALLATTQLSPSLMSPARADILTWQPNPIISNNNWSGSVTFPGFGTFTNWDTGTTPGNGDNLIFGASSHSSSTNDISNLQLRSITLDSDFGDHTINGSTIGIATSQFVGEGVRNTSQIHQTINAALSLEGSNTVEFFSGTSTLQQAGAPLILNGNITDAVLQANTNAASIKKRGVGYIVLNGDNSAMTGDIDLVQGRILLGGTNALSDQTTVNTSVSTVLDFDGHRVSVGGVSGNGAIELDRSSTMVVGANNRNTEFSGAIYSDGSVEKVGNGTLTLTGQNSYTGSTTVKSGTLNLTGDNLYTGAMTVTGGTLNLTGQNDYTGFNTVSGGTLNVGTGATVVGGLNVNGGTFDLGTSNQHFASVQLSSGLITGTGALSSASGTFDLRSGSVEARLSGTSTLTKSGSGTVLLRNRNTYTGNTVINDGTLVYGTDNALSDATDVVVNSGGTLDLNRLTDTIKSLSGNGRVQLDLSSLTVGASGGNGNFGGVISGVGSLTKIGTGTQTLSGINTYRGSAIFVDGGRLAYGTDDAISDATGVVVNSGGTLDLNGYTDSIGTLSGSGRVELDAGQLTVGGSNGSSTFSGFITGTGSLIKTGTGTLTLNSLYNTYSGGTTIKQGTLAIGLGLRPLGSGALTLDGGALSVGATSTHDNNVLLNRDGGTINVLSGQTLTQNGQIINGDSSSGILIKTGGGNLLLTNQNTYTGNTVINSGRLAYGTDNALSDATDVVVNSGGTLDLNGYTDTIDSLSGSGRVELDKGQLTVGAFKGSGTFSGLITGTGSLIKTGTGTLTLTGRNTYSGGTTIKEGTLAIGLGPSLGSGALTMDGGALSVGATRIYGKNVLINSRGGTIDVLSGQTLTQNGQIRNGDSSTGILIKTGEGTLLLANQNTYSGNTVIVGGRLELGVNNALSDATAVALFGGGTLDLNSRTDTIRSLDGFGRVELDAGQLTVGGLNGSGAFSGSISGTGTLTKIGTGTQTLNGFNTYTGHTFINAGTLRTTLSNAINGASGLYLGNSATFDLASTNQNVRWLHNLNGAASRASEVKLGSGTLTLNDGGSANFFGSISGSGGITKRGAGLQTLSGDNTYTGTTNVDQGTLALAGGQQFRSNRVNVASGAKLDLSGRSTLDNFSTNMIENNGRVDNFGNAKTLASDLINQGTVNGDIKGLTLTGKVSGAGNYEGRMTFDGQFRPGNSPALITAEDVIFGSGNSLFMELGGLDRGTAYDAFNFDDVTFGGNLDVSLIGGFNLDLGYTFDLFNWTSSMGTFANVMLPTLSNESWFWDVSSLYTDGVIAIALQVVPPDGVPGPGAIFILLVGVAGCGVMRKRRPA